MWSNLSGIPRREDVPRRRAPAYPATAQSAATVVRGTPRAAPRGTVPARAAAPHPHSPAALGWAGAGTALPAEFGQPLTGARDPRWVLALRVAEALEGAVLSPEKRERLVRLGRVLGLTAFDANLVIAIIQDQARRGHAPPQCPLAAEPHLALVPLPRLVRLASASRAGRWLVLAWLVAGILALELLVLRWWL